MGSLVCFFFFFFILWLFMFLGFFFLVLWLFSMLLGFFPSEFVRLFRIVWLFRVSFGGFLEFFGSLMSLFRSSLLSGYLFFLQVRV